MSTIINNVTKVQVTNSIITNNKANTTSVDCNNVHWVNNSATLAFANFPNLTTVSNIGNTVTHIGGMFYNCPSLVNAPTIPSSVVNTYKIITKKFFYGFTINPVFEDTMAGETYDHLFFETDTLNVGNVVAYVLSTWSGNIQELYSAAVTVTSISGNTYNITITDFMGGGTSNHTLTRDSSSDQESEVDPMQWKYLGTFTGCSNLVNAPSIQNGATDLSYMFKDCINLSNVPALPNSVTILNTTFQNCISLVNAPDIPDSVVSLYMAFDNCTNLKTINHISNNISNLYMAFYNCPNLDFEVNKSLTTTTTDVDMDYAFSYCTNLVNAPIIPNSVTSLTNTFSCCYNLVNAPIIPNSVNRLSYTFSECTSLTTAPTIPESVYYLYRTFEKCNSLTGDIYILSNNVGQVGDCFYNTSATKTVHIPFKYSNGVNSKTLNSFNNAGYCNICNGNYNLKHGVTIVNG